MMSPDHRLAAVLVVSAALSLPALSAMLADEIEPAAVGVRFGLAVAVVWAAVRLLERMVDGYGAGLEEKTAPAAGADEGATPMPERSRAGDEARAATSRGDTSSSAGAEHEPG